MTDARADLDDLDSLTDAQLLDVALWLLHYGATHDMPTGSEDRVLHTLAVYELMQEHERRAGTKRQPGGVIPFSGRGAARSFQQHIEGR